MTDQVGFLKVICFEPGFKGHKKLERKDRKRKGISDRLWH